MAGWSGWRRVALLVTISTMLLGAGHAAPPPIEHFTRTPELDDVVVSPSGKRAALLVYGKNGRRRVGVIDLDPVGQPRIVAGFDDADVNEVMWVDDDRLALEAAEPAYYVRDGGAGSFAVDHDGSNLRQLIAWRYTTQRAGSFVTSRVLPYSWELHSATHDGSGDVFVQQSLFDAKGDLDRVQLARLNTRTGELRNLSLGIPEGVRRWWLDVAGEPRMLSAYRDGRTRIYRRTSDAAAPWEKIADYDALKDPGYRPWHVERDGRTLVLARRGAGAALYELDPKSGQPGTEPLLAAGMFDIVPSKIIDSRSGRLLGVHFVADRPMSVWFDEGLQRLQRSLDASLPGHSNVISCGRCESARHFIVRSSSDRHPGEFLLFDREKRTLLPLGVARPWIDVATQGKRSLHRVEARDGLVLPVYVTRPAGAAEGQALPTVVLVHGGPFIRGSNLGWEAQAQFLASRGYLVLQPEFRGSEGYGFALFRAGWRERGRGMQTDLEDTLRWAAKTQGADAGRACVVGGSYGGYAALMAPIATPGVFRCAASFAGVTDLILLYDITWSDFSDAYKTYGMPVLFGPREDTAGLDAVSPLKRAAEIKVPLLVGHGAGDRRVPIDHARRFIAAARSANLEIESVIYDDEGHGFNKSGNEADWYGRLERFLARALDAAPASASK